MSQPDYPMNSSCYIVMNPQNGTWEYQVHFSNVSVAAQTYTGLNNLFQPIYTYTPTGKTTDISVMWGTSAKAADGKPFHLIDYVTADTVLEGISAANPSLISQAVVSGSAGVSINNVNGSPAGIREYIVPDADTDAGGAATSRIFDLPGSGAYTFSLYGNDSGAGDAGVCVMDGKKSVSVTTGDTDAVMTLNGANSTASVTSDKNLPATFSFIDSAKGSEVYVTGNVAGTPRLFVAGGVVQISGMSGDVTVRSVNNGVTATAGATLDGSAAAFDTATLEQREALGLDNPLVPMAFVDVNNGDWFYDDVRYVVSNGIFNGTTDSTFEPNSSMTRAMFVTTLWRMAAPAAGTNPASAFTDVQTGSYYAEAVNWAAVNGIVSGVSDGLFDPDGSITREQTAEILYRYEQWSGSAPPNIQNINFADADSISGYAQTAVSALAAQGIINGKTDGVFDPQGAATRAEVAAILRAVKILTPKSSTS